jgi:hypothetical protein
MRRLEPKLGFQGGGVVVVVIVVRMMMMMMMMVIVTVGGGRGGAAPAAVEKLTFVDHSIPCGIVCGCFSLLNQVDQIVEVKYSQKACAGSSVLCYKDYCKHGNMPILE